MSNFKTQRARRKKARPGDWIPTPEEIESAKQEYFSSGGSVTHLAPLVIYEGEIHSSIAGIVGDADVGVTVQSKPNQAHIDYSKWCRRV